MREKIIQNVSKMQARITDLQDMLDDGVPTSMRKKIVAEIRMLSDLIFDDQEFLENLSEST